MSTWVYLRPDALLVWRDPAVLRALHWYYSVMRDRKPAKFLIARRLEAPDNPYEMSLDELWRLHDRLQAEFRDVWGEIREGSLSLSELGRPRWSFLDVKIAIARRILESCTFCERRCGVNRYREAKGTCRLDTRTFADTWFHHLGEEAPLVPSGTIFYGSCNFRCVFCQNYEISQVNPFSGEVVDARKLAAIQRRLRETGARNINHVGGDPTPNIHTILESLKHLETNVPQLWNSNFYMSEESMKLLIDVIDIWLPDFKYGNNMCATRLSAAPRYFETVTRNLKIAVEHGDMIIRHLVLPGHIECCTKPVLKWIAENLPRDRVLVNVMDQYRPEHLVLRYPDRWPEIARAPSRREVEEAYRYAEELGLHYKQVSR